LAAIPIGTAAPQGEPRDVGVPLQLADNRPTFFTVAYPSGRRIDVSSADVLRGRISVDLHDASVAEAVDAIASNAGLVINYSSDVLPEGNHISLVAREISIEGALSVILLDTRLDVQVTGNQLTLVPRVKRDRPKSNQPEPRITGRVVDAVTHAPVEAAQVLLTGTTIGMATTDSGSFALRLPPDAKTLVVRRIGYLAQTVAINPGQSDYTVLLQRDVLRLEAQVVTGVATSVSSQNSANDVAVVSSQEVNEVPAPTVENSIQGQVPGALIQQDNGGAPGGGMQIQIRGITSLNANASPLYVVDGVIVDNDVQDPGNNAITNSAGGLRPDPSDLGVNRIADFNPDDIESIEVLKGASASAIYGSKASSGVIIITTKKGKSGKALWTFTQKVGQYSDSKTLPIRTFPTLGSAQAWYANDIRGGADKGGALAADNAFIAGLYAGPQSYQTTLFGNGQASYETDVSVSGTQGATQFFVSGLSKYDNGTLLNTGYNKQSIRSNVTEQFSSALSATANLFFTHSQVRRGISGNDNNGISPYDVFATAPQFVNLNHRNPDGSWAHNYFGNANPFADANDITTPETTQRFVGGGNISWTPYRTEHQSLQISAVGGVDLAHVRDDLFAPSDLQFEQAQALPGVSITQSTDNQYINYSINVIHHYTGLSWLDATTSAGFVRERRDLTNPETVSQNLLVGLNDPVTGTVQTNFYTRTAQRDQSFYGQEQILTLDQRLSVTAGVTAERTTNDGDIKKFYAYPRYSASYRIPQFVGFLDELKIRAALGSSGTQPNYGVRYTPLGPALANGFLGVASTDSHGDPNIKPESETEIETGFDATLLHSRAQLTFTVYQKRVSNLLLQAQLSPSRGFSQEWLNGGEFTNQGAEISLAATPVQLRNGFTWESTISFFRNYSVMNSLPVPPFAIATWYQIWEQVGRSVTDITNPNFLDKNGSPHQIGDEMPSFTMEGNEAVSWGPLRLSGLVQWNRGGTMQNENDLYYDFGSLWADSAYAASFVQKWDAGFFPWYQNAGFVKVRNISLTYTLPAKWINRMAGGRVSTARLALVGRNLAQWYSKGYTGLDPEVSSVGNQNVIRGAEVTPYPPSRSFFLSLDLGF
jgi:TonB-linked SusC/RagA family outer membrane protein